MDVIVVDDFMGNPVHMVRGALHYGEKVARFEIPVELGQQPIEHWDPRHLSVAEWTAIVQEDLRAFVDTFAKALEAKHVVNHARALPSA